MLTIANLKPKDIILIMNLVRPHKAEKEYENVVKQIRIVLREAKRLEDARQKPLNNYFVDKFYGNRTRHQA